MHFSRCYEGESKPVLRWGNAPMLPHVMRQGTDDEPNSSLQARAIELEQSGSSGVSVFTGFLTPTFTTRGFSAVAMTDGDADSAQAQVNDILSQAWEQRDAFVYEIESLPVSMERRKLRPALQAKARSLCWTTTTTQLLGTMDTTEVLRAVLDAGLERVAVFGIFGPRRRRGNGCRWGRRLRDGALGGKLPMPALTEQSRPLTITGEVKLISNGKFQAQVVMARGLTMNMGKSAVLSVGSVDIAIISRHIEPYDPECFRCLGMEPKAYDYVMLEKAEFTTEWVSTISPSK